MCVNEDKILRMKDLIKALTEADIAYYRDDDPVMSDREYDQLTDELLKLEAETGLVISGSPTQKVSGEVLEELTSVRHTKPMLSAKKTKSIEEMVRFAGGRSVLVSWKLDGLTIVLRYENGELKQSITRGREGTVGEDVTHTVRTYLNVPLTIPIRDSIEVRGEGVISWRHFNLINSDLEDTYSHPRNLAAGSTRKLDANESRKRLLEFFAFDLVSDHLERPSKLAQMQLMQNAGFSVVPFTYVDSTGGEELLRKAVDSYKPEHYGYPVDGLIVEYDDRAYGASLGATGHHENRMIALKWKDDPVPTKFLGVDLATTRTGRVSITGLFEPVAIDGAMVSRAYLHNLDIFDAFQFGVGDEIMVYKANQIIPQIAENKTKSGTFKMPMVCPCCGEKLIVRTTPGGSRQMYCENPYCAAKDNKNCFVESLSDAFEIGKAHLAFATYDLNKPAGNRQTNCVHIYISIPEWLELCRKLACGELRYLWQERKKAGDNRPVQEWLGGTSAEKLLQYGKARPDGKSLSRVARLCTAQKFDFLFTASSGPGDKDSKGLIVPRFGKKPENHVAVGMTWDALAELLLITKTHYEAWLAAWYLSQIQAANPQPPAKTRKAPEIPAQQPEPAIQSQYVMPEYSGKSLF